MQPPRPHVIPSASGTIRVYPLVLRALLSMLVAAMSLMPLTGCQKERGARVEAALARGEAFFHRIQRPFGEISDTLNPLFNTWETVEAASALYAISGDRDEAHLLAAALCLALQEDGLNVLCHNTACKGATCLETSAEYLLFLTAGREDSPGYGDMLAGRINAFRSLHQPDGAWQIGNPDVRIATAFPSVSGFALSVLNLYPQATDSTTPAMDSLRHATIVWLLSQQTAQGDWGSTWEYYGCPGYALWAILRGLHPHSGDAKVALAIKKAVDFIHATQAPDGSWYHSLPPHPQQHGTSSIKQTSPALQTALMLAALLATHPAKNDPGLERGIDFLLDTQADNGAWDGGFFPIPHSRYEKREYIFATAMALRVLAAYRDLYPTIAP